MQILFDYIPIIALFIAFMLHRGQADALIIATKVMMIATVVQVCGYWLIKRRLEKIHIITFALVMILGGATVFLRDEEFIKMKPTALYWLFSVIMIVGQWRKKNTLQLMLKSKISMPQPIWDKMTWSWIVFFLLLGGANLIVAHLASDTVWVNFKLFGTIALTLVFIVAQSILLSKHIEEVAEIKTKESEPESE